jgi:hypothetical protein
MAGECSSGVGEGGAGRTLPTGLEAWRHKMQAALEQSNNRMKLTKGGWRWGAAWWAAHSAAGCHQVLESKVAPFAAYPRVGRTRGETWGAT